MSVRSRCRSLPTEQITDLTGATWYGAEEWLELLDPCHRCGEPLEEGQGLAQAL